MCDLIPFFLRVVFFFQKIAAFKKQSRRLPGEESCAAAPMRRVLIGEEGCAGEVNSGEPMPAGGGCGGAGVELRRSSSSENGGQAVT